MEAFIIGAVAVFLVCILLLGDLMKVKLYEESFWWDTFNGINYSRSILYKIKWLPFYFIEHDENYRSPEEHPNYSKFLETVEKYKNKSIHQNKE